MALVVDSTTYTLVINSADRISGTNNNATFQVNWRDFLPDNYDTYKLAFSFQTYGGYYGDGTFSSSGPNIGATTNTPTTVVGNIGNTTLTFANTIGMSVGQIVIANGIPSSTTVVSINTSTFVVTLSTAIVAQMSIGTNIAFYAAANVNAATFSSARVLLINQGRSFSFDTQNKGPSSNLGILQRDIQLANSKSNSLSAFYCQNPPRSIARPNQNLITINIMNNYTFAGGIIGYSGVNNSIPIYSTTLTNQNFLTDTNATGSIESTDMTGYTMIIEFIPMASTLLPNRAGI
jgi:hypothetical protein